MLGFGFFAFIAALYVVVSAMVAYKLDERLGLAVSAWVPETLGYVASLSGLAAVMTSVMIYVATRRPMWTLGATTSRFMQTVALLGTPTALLISLAAAYADSPSLVTDVMRQYGQDLTRLTMFFAAIKLTSELTFLLHLRDPQMTAQKRSAQLLAGELSMVVVKRYFFGFVGGIALPALLLSETLIAGERYHPLFVLATAAFSLFLLVLSELHERYLFFTASVSPRMPGVPS